MGLVRLRIKEFAAEKGWTLKEVSDRSGVGYSALLNYAKSPFLGNYGRYRFTQIGTNI
jgi:putative transcriptional regulator